MATLVDTADAVIGVDSHTDTHTACLLDHLGRQLALTTIAADPRGCAMLLAWAIKGTRPPGSG
jgi:transposase